MLLDVAGMHGNPGGAVHMFGRKFLSCTRVVQGTVCSRNWSSGSVKDFFLVEFFRESLLVLLDVYSGVAVQLS